MSAGRFIAIALSCWALTSRSVATARDLAGVNMPEMVKVISKTLHLNGVGIGTEFRIIKVYVVGLYVEQKSKDTQALVQTDQVRRVTMTMLRDVSRGAFVQAVERGITQHSGALVPPLRSRLDDLERALPSLERGTSIDFTYIPGTGTIVRGKGKEMTIPGKDFSDALLLVWLAPKTPNQKLRNDLAGS